MTVRPPRVSVLTPVRRPVGRYLAELHAALDAQAGVEWEWVIQVDGGPSLLRRVPSAVRADPRVSLEANGRWLGQPTTRNLALARVRHPLLQTADADDLLLPGALAAVAEALRADPALGLAFGRTWVQREDGGRAPGKNPYPPGRIEPGLLVRDWERRRGSCSIVVGSVMWRTTCVLAHGGWAASVAGPDVLLLLAVAAAHPGACVDHDTYVYRAHPDQVHRGALRHAMRPAYRALARRMIAAREELGLVAAAADRTAAADSER
jgi:glycosyltransferase involved in cell wall biosynthesis